MAEALFDPVTGHIINEKARPNGFSWGVAEREYFGLAEIEESDLSGKELAKIKIDIEKLSEKEKSDILDRTKLSVPIKVMVKDKTKEEIDEKPVEPVKPTDPVKPKGK